jgi:hypothetical protein
MVPGPKVGLIIGKGGETIKQLQEKSGAKMVVIQDGPTQEQEKPLRISGEPQKVEVFLIYSLVFIKSSENSLYYVRYNWKVFIVCILLCDQCIYIFLHQHNSNETYHLISITCLFSTTCFGPWGHVQVLHTFSTFSYNILCNT